MGWEKLEEKNSFFECQKIDKYHIAVLKSHTDFSTFYLVSFVFKTAILQGSFGEGTKCSKGLTINAKGKEDSRLVSQTK